MYTVNTINYVIVIKDPMALQFKEMSF